MFINYEFIDFLSYIPVSITYIFITGILCIDYKIVVLVRKTHLQCEVIKDFIIIMVIIQSLMMMLIGILNLDLLINIEMLMHYREITNLVREYINLLFHSSVSLGFLYYIRHLNLTDSDRRKIIHCKNKLQEKE